MYMMTEGKLIGEDGNTYDSFGVKTPSGVLVADICIKREEVETFAERLNEAEASELHFFELIEDFLLAR